MSFISEKTDELFMAATLSDDDLGYPNGVEFVPADEEWADEVVWRNLTDGIPTVLVGEESELVLTPLRRGPLDRLRGRVPVNVSPSRPRPRHAVRDAHSLGASSGAADA